MAEPVERLAQSIVSWIRVRVEEAGRRGCVVGVSGGVDSAVALALCKRAFPTHTVGVVLPCHSCPEDLADAELVLNAVGVEGYTVELTRAHDALLEAIERGGIEVGDERDPARVNLKPRLRMATLYFVAARLGYLVVGTGNASELAVGYFTKYGDGGVDILPLGDLVKAEVRRLARYLGLPERIVEKEPSAGLWPGQTDEGEMGVSYAAIDAYLRGGNVSPEDRSRIEDMRRINYHKLKPPPICHLK